MSGQNADACMAVLAHDPGAESSSQQKQFATLQARAALRGIVLVESHTERGAIEYIASLHSMTKAFSSLAEVDSWLLMVEGRRA